MKNYATVKSLSSETTYLMDDLQVTFLLAMIFFFFSACLYNVNITPAMPRYLSLLYIVNGVYQYILFNREGKSKCRLLKMLY